MKYFSFVLMLCFTIGLFAQEKVVSINNFNFESTTTPAFTLLGESPTVINTPQNLKSLGVYISNGFTNTNFAVEINPYWFIKSESQRSYKTYRGIKTNRNGKTYLDPFIGWKTNSSISFGLISKKYDGFEQENKVIAIGGRTTMLQLYNTPRLNELLDVIKINSREELGVLEAEFEAFYANIDGNSKPGTGTCNEIKDDKLLYNSFLNAAEEFLQMDDNQIIIQSTNPNITKEELVTSYFEKRCKIVSSFVNNQKTIKPILRLDGAVGYSVLYLENEFNGATANRFGTWLTADVALKFDNKNYLHILALGKYLKDDFNINEDGQYFSDNFFDIGGKLELELNRFKLSYEYLRRTGSVSENLYRAVGNITYQLNEKISITGGFGKDFPVEENLISIIGLNWGLDLGEQPFDTE